MTRTQILALLKTVVLVLFLSFVWAIGLLLLGPFIDSPAYESLKEIFIANPPLERMVNIELMLIDRLVQSLVPLGLAWTIILALYSADSDFSKTINDYSSLFSFATGGTGVLVASWGTLVVGVACYGAHKYSFSEVAALGTLGTVIAVLGVFLRYICIPFIEDRPWLHSRAHIGAYFFGALTLSAFLYGQLAGPYRFARFVQNAAG